MQKTQYLDKEIWRRDEEAHREARHSQDLWRDIALYYSATFKRKLFLQGTLSRYL
jgi:hypothetical protein